MRHSSIVIDGLYNDVDAVRQMALNMEFGVRGNYPGQRTEPVFNQGVKDLIQKYVEPYGGKITMWDTEYTGSFQYTTQRDRSWVHADGETRWAGVCYLTPNAPLSGGTGLFRHKATGLTASPRNEDGSINRELLDEIYNDSQDMTKWEMTDFVGNVYNRLVIYRGDIFHTSLDYFGRDKYDGRLFQTFFFNTER